MMMEELDDDTTPTRLGWSLINQAEEHVRLFGEEEWDLADWMTDDDLSDPVVLAELVESLVRLVALATALRRTVETTLQTLLDGGAVRVGDVVYSEGSGSGTWSARPQLWDAILKLHASDEEVVAKLAAIVSGVRVTAIDAIGNDHGIDAQVIRNTFLEYRPGRTGMQRRDLRVEAVQKAARRWWPQQHGEVTRPLRVVSDETPDSIERAGEETK